MDPIKLLIVDDHDIVRASVRSLLEKHPRMEIVGEARGGTEAVALATQLRSDVVLMDFSLPGMNGTEATRRIKALAPEVRVLVLTLHEDVAYFLEILAAGASGYVPKRAVPDDLLKAIQAVADGHVFLHPIMVSSLVRDYLRRVRSGTERESYDGLTPCQQKVLALIAAGLSHKEIGSHLDVGVRTVQDYQENAMERLNLRSRAGLLQYGLREGLIWSDQGQSLNRSGLGSETNGVGQQVRSSSVR